MSALSHPEAMERFTVCPITADALPITNSEYQITVRDLESLVVQLPIASLSALPSNHDIRHLVRQVLYIAAQSVDHHRTPLLISQKIVQLLYKTSSQLGREIYVALLDQLCHSFEEVAKEAITWLLYAEDEVCTSSNFTCARTDVDVAQAQYPGDCHSSPQRTCEHFASGPAIGQEFVPGSSSNPAEFCGWPCPRVLVE